MSDEIVTLREYGTEFEAQLDASILEANEIPAQVLANTAGGAYPAFTFVMPTRLLVRAEDAERAREILDAPRHTVADEGIAST